MTHRIISLALTVMALVLATAAQDRLPGNIPTPGASSICRYGNIPMSYYTGTPEISIPLHTFKVRDVELPLYLSYDASGVRLHQLPNWTGENWTLHAGGCITRTINGYPDELVAPSAVQNPSIFYNYFESYGKMPFYLDGHMNDFKAAIQDEEEEFRDLEPDVFHFNFMGHSGSFFLGNDGQWKVAGDEDFDVIFNVANYQSQLTDPFINQFPCSEIGGEHDTQPKVIKGFRLRDTSGTEYEFGFDADAIEYTTPLVQTAYEQILSWYAVSWYLTKVTDRLGNILYTLSYNRGKFVATVACSYYRDNIGNSASSSAWPLAPYTSEYYTNTSDSAFPFIGELSSPVYLSHISTATGITTTFHIGYDGPASSDLYPSLHSSTAYAKWTSMANLNSTSSDRKCIYYLQTDIPDIKQYQYSPRTPGNWSDSILSRTRLGVLNSVSISMPSLGNKQYSFIYEFGTSRMHLVGLKEQYRGLSEGFVSDRKYEFMYDHYERLPRDYVTDKVDHWGYCRAAAEIGGPEHTLIYIPNTVADMENYESYRDMNVATVKYGTLTKIIYPTGGACQIEYEPNQFESYQNATRSAMVMLAAPVAGGGVRVKSIAEYNDSACTELLAKRTYTYSGGELFSQPKYYWPNWKSPEVVPGTMEITSFRVCSIVPLSNSFGPSVGYSTVTETRLDGAKIVRHYCNLSNSTNDELDTSFNNPGESPFDRFSEHGYMRGRLKKEEYYDSSGSKTLVSSRGYSGNYTNISEYVSASSVRMLWGSVNAGFKGRIYKLYYPRYHVYNIRDTAFAGNPYSITSTFYPETYHNIQLTTPYSRTQRVCLLDEERTLRGTSNVNLIENMVETVYSRQPYSGALAKQFYFPVTASRKYHNGTFIGGDSIAYDTFQINGAYCMMPCSEFAINPQGLKQCTKHIEAYTSTGQPYKVKVWKQPERYYFWGNNDNLLKAVCVGPHNDLSDIPAGTTFDLDTALEYVYSKIEPYNTERYYTPLGVYNFYVYNSMGDVTAIINADGTVMHFNRDRTLRVTDILDTNGKLMNHFEYNYQFK